MKSIFTPKKLALASLISAQFFSPLAHAADLIDVWNSALERDPAYISSKYEQLAAEKHRGQGTALWLPNVNLSATTASISNNSSTTGAQFYAPGMGTFNGANFNTSINNGFGNQYALSIVQPIFNKEKLSQSRQLKMSADVADLGWANAQQNLILLVAERYFDVLNAEETLRLMGKEQSAIQEMRNEMERRARLGNATQTDLEEANQNLNSIKLQIMNLKNDLELKKLSLNDLFPSKESIKKLSGSLNFSQLKLDPLSSYVEKLKAQNIQLRMMSVQESIAKEEVTKYGISASPTLNAIAQSSRNVLTGSGDFGTASNTNTNNMIGLQLNIPLYTGGYRSSKQEESLLLLEKTRSDINQATLNLEKTLRNLWYSLQSSKDKLTVLKNTQKSSQDRLESTKKSYEVGSRTSLELLAAENELIQNQQALYQEQVNNLLNRLRLASLLGELGEQDLKLVNAYLK
ncbi:outer membrane protein [Polynucleobacter sphagniphilus]|uniref:TolC family protein n=1 Tax=Polynucleobacter sphagniphilus TaxID=1743169 RepID=UPI00247448C9|nr:TolC family protein [Polynucleobacter sphagniphilus]MDH6421764.1 outer membrane protein [Polynucleobacter sphagniphilus]